MRLHEFTEDDSEEFLYGDCPIFAIALHKISGFPLQAMLDYSDEIEATVLIHAFVGYKNGKVIDASGVRTIEDIEDNYPVEFEPYVVNISKKDLLSLGYDGNCPTMNNAMEYARKVLTDIKKFTTEEDKETLHPPSIDVGDEVKVGKFRNSKATVKGFKKDDHGQPVLKTNKGDKKLFSLRLSKLQQEEAPPGREKQVKALKGKVDNPYAVAWASYNKSKNK